MTSLSAFERLLETTSLGRDFLAQAEPTGPPINDDITATGLAAAEQLIRHGIPVFAAEPALNPDGTWNPRSGHNGCGYWLPTGWQRFVATMNVLGDPGYRWPRRTWRTGDALCMVTGHGVDVLDVDPRNGGHDGILTLPVPYVGGVQVTPSGGYHLFIGRTGVASKDGVAQGVDLKAGKADGSGRGFVFIAPTVRASK